MKVQNFTVGPFAENTYLLTEDNKSIVIDPGFFEEDEFDAFLDTLDRESSELTAVVLTHAHVDHILGLNKVTDNFDIPVYLNDSDRYLWENAVSQAAMFGLKMEKPETVPRTLPVKKEWRLGPFSFEVRYTPGHAPDHVSLYHAGEQILVAGDVLFKEGIGRTDLYKGDFKLLEKTIREQFYTLPKSTVVYPGHGPKTTIGHEMKANPFVKDN